LYGLFQDLEIFGGRDAPHGLSSHHHAVLKTLFAAWHVQQYAARREAAPNLGDTLYPPFITGVFVPNDGAVLQFHLLSRF
jgi:hypothetical protein